MGPIASIATAATSLAGCVTGVGGVIRAVRDVFGGGGTDSVHYETAPPDPATLQLLEQIKSSSIEFEKRMDVALAALSERASTERAQAAHELEADFQAKVSEMRERQADPRRFVEIERGLFETFVQGLRRQFGPGAGPDAAVTVAATNQVMVAVIGRVASGKSTLINALLGRNACPTGVGRTTSTVRLVARIDIGTSTVTEAGEEAGPYRQPRPCINLFDVPGDDDRFNYLDTSGAISFLATVHVVVVLLRTCISDVVRYIRIAKAMGKRVIVVRTMVDMAAEGELSWQAQLQEDMRELVAIPDADLSSDERRVLGISARNVLNARGDGCEWREFRERLVGVGRAIHAQYGVAAAS